MFKSFIKNFSIIQIYIIMGFGYLLVIISFFTPLALFSDSYMFYPELQIAAFVSRFIQDNLFKLFALPIILYPYFFTIILLLLSVNFIRNNIFNFFSLWYNKIVSYKNLAFIIRAFKKIFALIIAYLPLVINLIIYTAFYLMPIKPFNIAAFGVFILAFMLLFSSYIKAKRRKYQNLQFLSFTLLALDYAFNSVVFVIMAIIILSERNILILPFTYLALLGFILLFIGLSLIAYKSYLDLSFSLTASSYNNATR